jgi:hypothetical protein
VKSGRQAASRPTIGTVRMDGRPMPSITVMNNHGLNSGPESSLVSRAVGETLKNDEGRSFG